MLLNHDIQIDLTNPGPVPRVHVKQGDTLSRNVRIYLYANGEPWPIPDGAAVRIRYNIRDSLSMQERRGSFDTLEDGSPAYIYGENLLEIMPTTELMSLPGLATLDVVLICENQSLATFDFEIYVNRAPAMPDVQTN